MKKTIFEFTDYRIYLLEKLKSLPKHGYGVKVQLASHLNCQAAYVSQVLKGAAHLSLEQAEKTNSFFGHTKEEGHFFILLLSKERAGTESLKKYFQAQIEEALQKRLVLKNRFGVVNNLTEKDKLIYYSQWYYAAIHIAITVPELQTRESLSEHFGFPKSKISEILEFLCSCGLAIEENSRFKTGTARIHLGSDSPLISKNHISWRMRAVQSLEKDPDVDLHYSTVVSLSQKDVLKIKSDLVKKIEDIRAVVKESPEETLQCLVLDFFKV